MPAAASPSSKAVTERPACRRLAIPRTESTRAGNRKRLTLSCPARVGRVRSHRYAQGCPTVSVQVAAELAGRLGLCARSTEIRDFLRTRRARVTPEQAGLAPHSAARRVPGLRREEVAQLAGVSVDYYIRLERGRTRGVFATVLEAVAREPASTSAEALDILASWTSASADGPRAPEKTDGPAS